MKRFSVVLTRDRNDWCRALVDQLRHQGSLVIVVNNNDEDNWEKFYGAANLIYRASPFNYSFAVNLGLDAVKSWNARLVKTGHAEEEYLVGVFNDDLILPIDFFNECEIAVLQTGAAVAFPGQGDVGWGRHYLNRTPPSPVRDHRTKMTGFAHVARGSLGLRFDESMKIWYSDNDYEMQARENGGTVMVCDLKVQHLDANGNFARNPEWQQQAGVDRETFKDKWGFYAWA